MPGFELIGKEERDAVLDIFDNSGGVLFRHGFDAMRKGRFRVIEFQDRFAEYLGSPHALAVSSGTAAVKVALEAVGVGPGDEVVTQAFTFVATAEAIIECGAKPVFTNVDSTLNMDPDDLAGKITPRTKAILPVHMLGVAVDMDRIAAIAAERDIPVIEENCESLGARWDGRFLGTLGAAGTFSFDFGKVITTGEGGMVTANIPAVYRRAVEYHDHGHENNSAFPRGKDTRSRAGFNYRMSELQAAVGLAQLAKLDGMLVANKRNYQILEAGVARVPGVTLRAIPEKCEPLHDTLIFMFPSAENAAAYVRRLGEAKLGTKNIPDALDWHFAGTWTHMAREFGLSASELQSATQPSADLLARSVSIPVMIRESEADARERARALGRIAAEVLGVRAPA